MYLCLDLLLLSVLQEVHWQLMQLCLEVIFDPCCRKNKEKLELDQSPYWIEQLEKERYSPEYIELKQVVEPQGLKYIFCSFNKNLFHLLSRGRPTVSLYTYGQVPRPCAFPAPGTG